MYLLNVQSGSKSCITLNSRSAQLFDRCVGIGVGSLDKTFSEISKLLDALGKFLIDGQS